MSVSTEEVAEAFYMMAKAFSSMEKIATYVGSKNGNGSELTDEDMNTLRDAVDSFTNDIYEISEVIKLKTICQIFKSMKKSKTGNQNNSVVKLTGDSSKGDTASNRRSLAGQSSSKLTKRDNTPMCRPLIEPSSSKSAKRDSTPDRPFVEQSSSMVCSTPNEDEPVKKLVTDDHEAVQDLDDDRVQLPTVESVVEGSKPIPSAKTVLFSEQSAFIKPKPRMSTEQPRSTIPSLTVPPKTTSPFNISQKKFECIKPEPYTFRGSSKASVSTRSIERSTKHQIIKPVPYTFTKGLKTPVIAERTTSIESLQQNFEPIKVQTGVRGAERSQKGGRQGSRTKSSPLEMVQKMSTQSLPNRRRGSRRRGRRGRRRYAEIMDSKIEKTDVAMEVDDDTSEQDDLLNTINETIDEINSGENTSMLLDGQFLLDNLDITQEESTEIRDKEDMVYVAKSNTQADNKNIEQMEIVLLDEGSNTQPVTSTLKQVDIKPKLTLGLQERDVVNNAFVNSFPKSSSGSRLSQLFNYRRKTATNDDDIPLKKEIYNQVLNFAPTSKSSTDESKITASSPNSKI